MLQITLSDAFPTYAFNLIRPKEKRRNILTARELYDHKRADTVLSPSRRCGVFAHACRQTETLSA
jgi:hypothetical protein